MNSFYLMNGGVSCSLCGSEGTNKSSCPLNPDCTNPKPEKHPLTIEQIDISTSLEKRRGRELSSKDIISRSRSKSDTSRHVCEINDRSELEKIKNKLGIDDDDLEDSINICYSLKNIINEKGCLKGWFIKNLLGIGTVGTVLGICANDETGVCHAIKLQKIQNASEKKIIARESSLQKKAINISPKIFNECYFNIGRQEWYAIIMEKLDNSLDSWLSTEKTLIQLEDVYRQLEIILNRLNEYKLIHGDLVWFNIGYIKDSTKKSGIRLLIMDFDRASHNLIEKTGYRFINLVDLVRLIDELDPNYCVKPPIMKEIHPNNALFLRNKLIEYGNTYYPNNIFANNTKFKKDIDNIWYILYLNYCKLANVKCLDGYEGELVTIKSNWYSSLLEIPNIQI